MNPDTWLLTFIAPARRRDDVVDTLLAVEAISGFTFSDCGGFSRAHSHFNLREQVQGYGEYERFEVLCSERAGREVLARLQEIAGADGFRYWLTPISEQGTLKSAAG
jgi:hypothetical protein